MLSVTRELDEGASVTLAADSSDIERTLTQLRIVLLLASVAVLVIAALALGTVVRTALAPLDRMTALAHSITAGDRGRRLRPDRPGTELGRTAGAFDDMLDELEGAERRARDGEVRVREFVSDAAHELRTPVAGVQAAAESMLRTDPPRAERERLAVTVVREARRASRLVEDMLAMAEIDRGLQLHPTPTDLRAVASAAADRSRLRHDRLRVVVSGSSVTVSADADRLAQVLGNLLDNAARASAGEVRVEVSTSDTQATVDVRDDGPGIPDGDRERVFERLVRLDTARDRDHGGAGLGLPIARGIARAHGGDLVAMPSTGGAWFRLSLPVGGAAGA